MFYNIFHLFKIARKLGSSGAIETLDQIHKLPSILRVFFNLISIGASKNILSNNKRPGQNLCEALEKMGTTFIKLGQFLATRPDIIGEELANDLEKLQDKLPPFDINTAKNILRKNYGEKKFKTIKSLSDPVAAASIAQVHFAVLEIENIEKEVAIKILRPEIEKLFNKELNALLLLAFITEKLFSKTKRLKLTEVVLLLRKITKIEMDLRFEAAAANELYSNTKNDQNIQVPKIYWDYTSKEILTLDRVNGVSIRDIETLKKQNVDTQKLAKNLIQLFLIQAVRDGFFHGDMHQGNLFVNPKGEIVPVDFGIMGRLDKNNRKFLAEILFGFIQRDYQKVAEVHFQAGLVPNTASKDDFAQALRSVGEPIFGQSIKDISGGRLLAQLFEITERFNMQTQTQLLLLQKTMVVVEGVARKLYPNTNIWEVSKPILENWIKSQKDPKIKINDAIKTSGEIFKRIPELPDVMDKANYALQMIAEGKLNIVSKNDSSYEVETLKLEKNKNKFIVYFLGIVIIILLLF